MVQPVSTISTRLISMFDLRNDGELPHTRNMYMYTKANGIPAKLPTSYVHPAPVQHPTINFCSQSGRPAGRELCTRNPRFETASPKPVQHRYSRGPIFKVKCCRTTVAKLHLPKRPPQKKMTLYPPYLLLEYDTMRDNFRSNLLR